ncbi:hypothetical protein AB4212_29890 [Streptomyces sp. 2MCAF27]
MSDAVYGLLGALGGSAITAAVAYWGPLQVERRRHAQQREAAREAAREARMDAEASRAELRTQAEEERRAAEAREAAAVEKARKEEAKDRIIDIRTSTREWSQLLGRYVQDLSRGRPVDIAEFDLITWSVQRTTQSLLDASMRDWHGYVLGTPGYQDRGIRSERRLSILPPEMRTDDVFQSLVQAGRIIRGSVLAESPVDPGDVEIAWQAMDRVEEQRRVLNSRLRDIFREIAAGDRLPPDV